MAQAKKVAIRASKGMLDPATRGEKKVKVRFPLPTNENTSYYIGGRRIGNCSHKDCTFLHGLVYLHLQLTIVCIMTQEEEQRLRKVALNISKDVKKFWLKIEKLASLLRIWVLVISPYTCDISKPSSQNIVVPGSVQASART